jgi:hypothetical protein
MSGCSGDLPEGSLSEDQYSFDAGVVELQFLVLAMQMASDLLFLAKMRNLLRFRDLYTMHISSLLPEQLLMFHPTPPKPIGANELSALCDWPAKPATYDLATEVRRLIPRDWVPRYFVISTFPAMFGHFMSLHFHKAASTFITSHVMDELAPELVGTFLHHSFMFSDRFLNVLHRRLT